MNYGVIDIGANTIRFNVFRIENNIPISFLSKKNVAGLVTYIQDGKLSNKGIKKLIMVLNNQLATLKYFNPTDIFVFATASIRNTLNCAEVVSEVKEKCNIDIEILSQEQEAILGLEGIQYSLGITKGITVDIGGGSTEIVKFTGLDNKEFFNLSFGCLSLYSKYVDGVLLNISEIKKINAVVSKAISKNKKNTTDYLIGIGGSVRAIGNIVQELFDKETNKEFTTKEFMEFYELLILKSKPVIKTVLQVVPERIHTIITGAIILKNILEFTDANYVKVCSTGLREGLLLKKIKDK